MVVEVDAGAGLWEGRELVVGDGDTVDASDGDGDGVARVAVGEGLALPARGIPITCPPRDGRQGGLSRFHGTARVAHPRPPAAARSRLRQPGRRSHWCLAWSVTVYVVLVMGVRMRAWGPDKWQAVVALVVLVLSVTWAVWLNVGLFPDAPTRSNPGTVLVDAGSSPASEHVAVHAHYAGPTQPADPGWGEFVITGSSNDGAPLGKVTLYLCGPLAAAHDLSMPGVDGSVPVTASPYSDPDGRNISDNGIFLNDCVVLTLDAPTGFRVDGTVSDGWVSRAGDRVLYALPGVRPLVTRGRIDTIVGLMNPPDDLSDVVTIPTTDALEWKTSAADRSDTYRVQYRVAGVLVNTQSDTQRALIFIGLALGLATSAAIWLLEIGVHSAVKRSQRRNATAPAPEAAGDTHTSHDPTLVTAAAPDAGEGPEGLA